MRPEIDIVLHKAEEKAQHSQTHFPPQKANTKVGNLGEEWERPNGLVSFFLMKSKTKPSFKEKYQLTKEENVVSKPKQS